MTDQEREKAKAERKRLITERRRIKGALAARHQADYEAWIGVAR